MKSKISAFWKKLDVFCKISVIALALVVILTIVAIIVKNVFAIIFSVLQLVGLIVALLIHNDVIKMEKKIKWIRFLILVVAVALSYLNIVSYSWGKNKTDDSISTNQPTYSDSSISDEAETTKETTKKKPFPFGTEECIGNKESIKYDIKDAGFTNLTLTAIEDLSPSEAERVGEIESITVNGQSEFTKGQEFDYDSEVVITYHEYKKCKVTVRVDFLSNLIFSKYNVNIKFDGLKEGILEHGVDGDFEFMVRPGEHTITFESAETSSVTGEAKINVDCDIDVSYQISCYNDKVTVTEKYLDRLVEVPEGKIKLEAPVSEYKYKNYSEVESALKSLGFTNIKYEILYDIVFGITQEGEVDKVSIAGNSDFKRGDIFSADDEIIITYHMKEEDNPNKPNESNSGTSSSDSTVETNPTLTIENSTDFSSLMKITDQTDVATIKSFVNAHKGDTIEFDGCIVLMMKHEDYKTRFDVCMAGGNYSDGRLYGPLFAFEDVSYYSMNVSGSDTVAERMSFRITAKIKGFSDAGNYIILEPVELVAR